MIRLLSLFSLAILVLMVGISAATTLTNSAVFLDKVREDFQLGKIDLDEALLYKFHYGFDSSKLPPEYRVEGFSPLRCGTAAIMEYYLVRDRLRPETISTIESYLVPDKSRLAYTSAGGHFQLSYDIIGTDAVPILDIDPPNGIPDYVEKIADYFEEVWAVEVDGQGFTAPPIGTGTYAVTFEAMDSYGYTTVVSAATGLTRIVMHNNYNGFPGNDDPDGAVWGAAKVTAAHEFKHATQYATSRWSEGGWNEVDAVWAEDFVYDQVNDYYNYLPGESPVRHPEIPLDGGSTGTGSYDDCVWEIWLSETFGARIITDYWDYRSTHTYVTVMDSWEWILEDYGFSFAEGWAKFTAWNYGTGYRAVAGVGYGEAVEYPYGNYVGYATSYPFVASGSVEHLAANQIRLLGFDGTVTGALEVDFNGTAGGPLTLAAHVQKRDGTGVIEVATLDEGNDGYFIFSTPLEEMAYVGLVVGNAAMSGSALAWSLTVDIAESAPEPELGLDATTIMAVVEEGETATRNLQLSNVGQDGSELFYDVVILGDDPGAKGFPLAGEKSVSGSTLTCSTTSYLSGTTADLVFTVYNGSSDDEWLDDLTIVFPAGVTANSSTDFMGGSLGDLLTDNATGDGATIHWHGTYGTNYYGVVKGGEYASSTINISVDAGFSGDLTITTTIAGDDYGSSPHSIVGSIQLSPGDPELAVVAPNGGEIFSTGESVSIVWVCGGLVGDLIIELSRDGGQDWEILATGVANTGSHSLVFGAPGSNYCLVRVSDESGNPVDISDAEFSLFEPVSWLACSPDSGTMQEGEQVTLTLDFTPGSLSVDTYTAYLAIENSGLDGTVLVPVTMVVTPRATAAGTPGVFALDGNYPNPFNPKTVISFSLDREGMTTIEVLDVRGHLVAKLFQGSLEEGSHAVHWDGRDARGRMVAAGTYLARLRTVGHEAVTKMVLAK